MSFVRRKRGQVLLVHSERVAGTARVRQRTLHRFASPSELEAALAPGTWTRWSRALAWREGEVEFDWPALRARLREELTVWRAAPGGATHRRHQKIERLASELVAELAPLSLAKASDAAVVGRLHASLVGLRESIERLLPSPHKTARPAPTREAEVTPETLTDTEELFDDGMEHWWEGDRRSAARVFRRVLKLDPQHADAHNHLGIIRLEARRLKDAERHFRAAIEGGQRGLEREGDKVPWGYIKNRPYLRALANLALALLEQERSAEALALHQQLLTLNPDDHQGVRFLIGPESLRVGDDAAAIEVFQRGMHEEVGAAFGLALARLRAQGRAAAIGESLLTGFAANRYVAPMLLGEPWERLDADHLSAMAEPEWAHEVVAAQGDLWQALPLGAELLRFWWAAPAVADWRRELDAVMLRLKGLAPGKERSARLSAWSSLRSEEAIRELARGVRACS